MTWTNITGTTTISASRAVTLPVRFRSEPIKILALHPGSGIGGTLTIWDENGRSVQVTRLDPNQSRYEAEFYSDVDGFNYSFAADGNGAIASPGISVYLVSRPAADPDIVNGTIAMSGPVTVDGPIIDSQSKNIGGARVDLLDEEAAYATWTGIYTGTGTGTITTELPFVPDLVIVKGTTFGAQVWHRAAKNTSSNNFDGYSADSDYLTVSGKKISCTGASQLNTSGIVYKIIAICDPYETVFSPRSAAYSTQPMELQKAGLSFALLKRDNFFPPFLLFGTSCRSLDQTRNVSGASLGADGVVTLPDNNNVNTGENTSVLGFKGGRNLHVFRYEGDNANQFPIYLPFTETDCVWWIPLGTSTQQASMFFPGLDAANIYSFQGQAVAALPGAFQANRITLTAGATFNKTGESYLCVVFGKQQITPSANLGYASAPRGKQSTLLLAPQAYLDCGFSDSLMFSDNGTFEWFGCYNNGVVSGNSAGNDDAVTRCLFARAKGDYGVANAVSFGLFAGLPWYLAATPTYIAVTGGSANFPNSGAGTTSGPTVPISYSLISVPQAQWDHFVVTVEGGTKWKYFKNGKLLKIYDHGSTDARFLLGGSGHRMVIGGLPGIGSATPTQKAGNLGVSVIRLYSRALSAVEIAANYRSAVSGKLFAPTPDFVEEWNANNYSGGVLPATRNPANNGTLSGVARLLANV